MWTRWHPFDILEVASEKFHNVEHEKETIWGKLNGMCQDALLVQCDVPHICERVFFDPTPRSQY